MSTCGESMLFNKDKKNKQGSAVIDNTTRSQFFFVLCFCAAMVCFSTSTLSLPTTSNFQLCSFFSPLHLLPPTPRLSCSIHPPFHSPILAAPCASRNSLNRQLYFSTHTALPDCTLTRFFLSPFTDPSSPGWLTALSPFTFVDSPAHLVSKHGK